MGEDPGQIRQEIEETRAQMGDTVDALAYKADVKERAKDSITEKKERAVESFAQTKKGAQRAAGVAQENPIGLAIGGVAVGFLAGMVIPRTRLEDERMGPVADQAREKALEAGQEAVERGKTVVQEAAETAREKGSEQARQLSESTQQKAKESVQA
jgi:hypothetical protein